MDWRNKSPEEKAEMLEKQMAGIQKAKNLLSHFEKLTQKWLENLQNKKPAYHGRHNSSG